MPPSPCSRFALRVAPVPASRPLPAAATGDAVGVSAPKNIAARASAFGPNALQRIWLMIGLGPLAMVAQAFEGVSVIGRAVPRKGVES